MGKNSRLGWGLGQGKAQVRREAANLPAGVREALLEVRAAAQAGRHDEAGRQLMALHQKAERHGRPGVAVHLALRAVIQWARAGQPGEAQAAASQAIAVALGEEAEVHPRAARKVGLAVARLKELGFTELAEHVATAAAGLGEVPAAPQPNRSTRRSLPNSCPECGHPVVEAQVEWLDESHPHCAACGSPLVG